MRDLFLLECDFEYAMWIVSGFIDNRKYNDKFTWLIGDGSNGKSVLLDVLAKTLSNFTLELPSKFFSNDTQTFNGAAPALLRLKDCKIAILAEPEKKNMLGSMVKRVCGNDRFSTRQMYSSKILTFKYQCKFLPAANSIPTFDEVDAGLLRRIQVLNFSTKFVEHPAAQHERPLVADLDKKYDNAEFHCAFFNLLAFYHKKYHCEPSAQKPEIPENAKIIIKMVSCENQTFGCYVNGRLSYSNEQCVLKIQDVIESYCSAKELSIPNKRLKQ